MKAKRSVGQGSIPRKLLTLLFVGLFFLSVVFIASADPGWSYYRTITIDHTKVEADLENFPVLINLSGDWLKYTGHGGHVNQTDGGDIVFTDDNNTVKYDHEIEKYDGINGTLVAWIRIPSLSASENTTIRMWYGNSECANQWNPTGVWDSNYKGVWHLNGTDGATPTQHDSTPNNNDGTPNNTETGDFGVSGQIDGAEEFDGSDDYIDCENDASLNITDAITIEAWVKPSLRSYRNILTKGDDVSVDSTRQYDIAFTGQFVWTVGDGVTVKQIVSSLVPEDNWYHVVFTYSDSDNSVEIYVNGALDRFSSTSLQMQSTNYKLVIGKGGENGGYYFKGTTDEVRISDIARSAEWIKTCYNNQNDPSFFCSLGDELEPPEFPKPVPVFTPFGLLVLIGILMVIATSKIRKQK